MHASNKPYAPTPATFALLSGYGEAVAAMWAGALGHTVRCVPTRRTVVVAVAGGWLFGKWRRGRERDAAAEWRWLHMLPLLGIHAAAPVAWVGDRRRSLLVTAGLPGRSLDAWAVDAARGGWLPQLVAWACSDVAPVVRRLHDQGLVYRDLYWNHVMATDPRLGGEPRFLDVERVFEPRWRKRRWIVKDLAGLWASVPIALPERCGLRFLRHYLGLPLRAHRRLILAIAAKARRIRQHVPRYG
ncbi:MAG TPA: lipopolysaccharide kinase InaA family protein [Planctomycetota bacterium]